MITLYSHTPEGGDRKSRAVCFATLGVAGALILLSEVFAAYKPVFQTLGFIIALFGILLCARLLMTSYTYSLEAAADGTPPDLVIRERRGKIDRTVCRVSVSGGRLTRAEDSKKPKGEVYDYRPSPFAPTSWVFEVAEVDGGGFVKFNPDEKMIAIMRSVGCEVVE
jgi:hypothetical protein